ncbi:MAG: TonB-dependent receptor [Candidatus Marinimicrobia bacterium]|nr:TonB-dependent receptor [Candidatus Neomarinimicrobiota bacterium]
MIKYFLILIHFISFLNAFSIRGNVVDNNSTPVSFAIIQNISSGQWEIGDEFGHFTIVCALQDSLIIKRYGYEQSILIVENNSHITIFMKIDPIVVDPVVINENRSLIASFSRHYDFEQKVIGGIASKLRQLPGIQIRSYGGLAGNATVSIDGGSGSHTKIIYEGIDLTSPQNGGTDISQLPGQLISSASMAPQPGLFYGSGTTDGIIYLKNAGHNTSFTTSFGNWGRHSWTAQKGFHVSKLKAHASIGQLKAEDNYKVQWRGEKSLRKNNHFSKDYSTLSFSSSIHPRFNLTGSFLYSKQNRGVAGLVYSPSLNASRNDELVLMSISGSYLLSNGFLNGRISKRNSDENYIDPDYAIDSRHTVYSNQLHVSAKLNISPNISIHTQGEYSLEGITSTDTDHQRRNNVSGLISADWNRNSILLRSAIRFDKIGNTHQGYTYNTDLTWKQSTHIKHIISVGTSLRVPSFNDMYWIPGGNEHLQPEEAVKVMIIHSWQSEKSKFDLTTRHIKSTNLIQWVPGENHWQAENIASTDRTSLTLSSQLLLPFFDFNGHITRLWTRDYHRKNSLRYAPDYSGFIALSKNFKSVSIAISGHYTGERIAMYDFPEDEILPDYFISSASISFDQSIFNQIITVSFSIENMSDKQYQTVLGYPEPGRAFNLTFNIHPKEKS